MRFRAAISAVLWPDAERTSITSLHCVAARGLATEQERGRLRPFLGRGGGTVDAGDSKSPAGNSVSVQIRPSVPSQLNCCTKSPHKMFGLRNDSRVFARNRSLLFDGAAAGKSLRGVALFHIGRSGSTMLGDLLDQHSAIAWDGEIYEHAFQRVERKTGPLFLSSDTSLLELCMQPWSELLPPDALEYLQERIALTQKSVYGFEVKFFHLRFFGMSLVDYVEGLKNLGFDAFVILKRRNLLRAIVSSLHKRGNIIFAMHRPCNVVR